MKSRKTQISNYKQSRRLIVAMSARRFFIAICLFLLTVPVMAAGKGEQLSWGCVSCHGKNGESAGPATPVIAGLSKNYLIGAMLSYKYSGDLDKAVDIIEQNDGLEDVRVMKRFSAIMQRVAKAYTLEEIRAIANYLSSKNFVRPVQEFDASLADSGKKLHKKYCDKCHEDWGRSTEDDVGLLAGQWKTYLQFTLEDFKEGDREMSKKMKKKFNKMYDRFGDDGLRALIAFYSSQR